MMRTGNNADTTRHNKAIATGAVVNVLGIAGKSLFFLFFILSTRLYGVAATGTFYLAYTMIEVAIAITVSGFGTGTLMFASRYTDDESKESLLYQALANGFVISLLISALLVLLSRMGGPEILLSQFPQANLLEAVQLMAPALPCIVVLTIVIAATKARLTMKWDAILLGFVRPGLLTLFAAILYFFDLGLTGLCWAYTFAQFVVAVIALCAFGGYFSYSKLFAHIRHFKLFKPLLTFAIPQNLNTTFGTLITNLDVLMLGWFGHSEATVLFYGMGSQIVRNIRQVKLALSGSFAPVIARLHERGDTTELSESFSRVTRWITALGFPLALIVSLLRMDLLHLFDGSFSGDTTFMLLLLVPPLLSCSFGLSGNIVVMTGHSRWNLFNAVTVGVANAALNMLLIPRFGVIGAAGATAIASFLVSMLQLAEARILAGARLIPSQIYKPYLAILPAAGVAVFYSLFFDADGMLPARIGVAVLCTVIFAVILILMRIDPRFKALLFFWKR
ncbi:MAG: oligosaccharide flippase family protein [Deltaproteobacteria bacterium]|nr:oligosaccharide flippase family protein [Deltaproteobacteria bacterium]